MSSEFYAILANGVLVAHFGLVLFIVFGLILVLLGGRYRWAWVRNFWFRISHLCAIGYVVAESWLGIVCPLTNLEQGLRERAGQVSYQDDFIAHWLGNVMFYQAPPWSFIAAYSLFALLVLVSWAIVRPRSIWPIKSGGEEG
jgi:hypothetical protein